MKMKLFIVGASLVCGASLLAQNQNSSNADQPSESKSQSTQSSTQQDSSSAQGGAAGSQTGTTVNFNQLPQEVQKTMRAQAGASNLESIQKFTKQGEACFRATFDKGGMKGKIAVAEDGSLLQSQVAKDLAIVARVPAVTGTETSLNELPQKVQQTIQQQADSAKIGGISKTSQSGETYYHAAFNEGGVHTDLWVSEDGTLAGRSDQTALFIAPLRSPQSVSLASAPQAVQKTVREHAGAARVADIDKGNWQGQTAYKVMVEKNGMPRPLLISESGALLGGQSSSAAGSPAATETDTEKPATEANLQINQSELRTKKQPRASLGSGATSARPRLAR